MADTIFFFCAFSALGPRAVSAQIASMQNGATFLQRLEYTKSARKSAPRQHGNLNEKYCGSYELEGVFLLDKKTIGKNLQEMVFQALQCSMLFIMSVIKVLKKA